MGSCTSSQRIAKYFNNIHTDFCKKLIQYDCYVVGSILLQIEGYIDDANDIDIFCFSSEQSPFEQYLKNIGFRCVSTRKCSVIIKYYRKDDYVIQFTRYKYQSNIQKHIESKFDLDIVQQYFDGKYHVMLGECEHSVYWRRFYIADNRYIRYKPNLLKERIKKYESRGFLFVPKNEEEYNLVYGHTVHNIEGNIINDCGGDHRYCGNYCDCGY